MKTAQSAIFGFVKACCLSQMAFFKVLPIAYDADFDLYINSTFSNAHKRI